VQAGLDRVPIVVRDLDRAAVIEAMLVENTSRNDLTISDEVAAIAKLISLDGALTPAKLCKRIGKSQRWVRDRMTITVLPPRWIDAVRDERLTLTQAVAAAGAADLGPDHVEALCEELAGRAGWDRDPARIIEAYRRRIKLDADEDEAIARCQQGRIVYFTRDNRPPNGARALRDLGIDTGVAQPAHRRAMPRRLHRAVIVDRPHRGHRLLHQPQRHHPTKGDQPAASAVLIERPHRHDDDQQGRRLARVARLSAGADLFARRRGGPTSSELIALALHSFIEHASADAAKFAAAILGLDGSSHRQALAAHAATSAARLAQAAGAVACGTAEAEAFYTTSHGVAAWYRLLTDHGWEPDDWTGDRLDRAARAGDEVDDHTTDDGTTADEETKCGGDNQADGCHPEEGD
jgi:hypothetical protein